MKTTIKDDAAKVAFDVAKSKVVEAMAIARKAVEDAGTDAELGPFV
ncbi:hypothetical protein G7047_00615 [Diaphorobacter sp. HDW4A]|nr:hypothetical protein [Diaphorobacter sp. HDW4A]QIL78586.1 hypothetical protein G7047_00615 [Diaphorobacter sp. HDW4A]